MYHLSDFIVSLSQLPLLITFAKPHWISHLPGVLDPTK
jgi:hypothetical protein